MNRSSVRVACGALVLLWGISSATISHAESDAAPPDQQTAIERLAHSMHAAERTRSVVMRILNEANATFLTLWAYEDTTGPEDEIILTPDERRSRNWDAFYKNPDARMDYDRLAQECIAEVYSRHFSGEELGRLADFLERAKSPEEVREFAQTPLGRKYRAVMRRLSSEMLMFIQKRVDATVQSVLSIDGVPDEEGVS